MKKQTSSKIKIRVWELCFLSFDCSRKEIKGRKENIAVRKWL
jgi:hypothetical protein